VGNFGGKRVRFELNFRFFNFLISKVKRDIRSQFGTKGGFDSRSRSKRREREGNARLNGTIIIDHPCYVEPSKRSSR